jgi:VTC domain
MLGPSASSELWEQALSRFAAADATLLAQRELLRRSDSKFLTSAAQARALIERLAPHFAVLPVGAGKIATYRNLYFDTPDLRSYHDHRRGRRIRHKVRIRRYPERGLAYLEIKTRCNETMTEKFRLGVPQDVGEMPKSLVAFAAAHCPYAAELAPVLEIDYRRIGLLGLGSDERVTVDYDVTMRVLGGPARTLEHLAIIEVKQATTSATSPALAMLRAAALRQCSFSKYSVAAALTLPVPCQPFNRTLRAIERILP